MRHILKDRDKIGLVHITLCSVAMFPALGTLCNRKAGEEPGNNTIALYCQCYITCLLEGFLLGLWRSKTLLYLYKYYVISSVLIGMALV